MRKDITFKRFILIIITYKFLIKRNYLGSNGIVIFNYFNLYMIPIYKFFLLKYTTFDLLLDVVKKIKDGL